jgi:hypothetical protein
MTKNVIAFLCMFLTLGIFSPCRAADCSLDGVDIFYRDSINSDKEFEAICSADWKILNSVKKSDDLIALAEKWKNDGVPLSLLKRLIDDPSGGLLSSDTGGILQTSVSIPTQHNLSSVGGKNAWLLEQLFGWKLFPVTYIVENDVRECLRNIPERKQFAEEIPSKMVDILRLSREEKLKLAKDVNSSRATLVNLSRDKDEEVKKAAQNNPKIPVAFSAEGRRTALLPPDPCFIRRHKSSDDAVTSGTHPAFPTVKTNVVVSSATGVNK